MYWQDTQIDATPARSLMALYPYSKQGKVALETLVLDATCAHCRRDENQKSRAEGTEHKTHHTANSPEGGMDH